jgi:hypothetical protein
MPVYKYDDGREAPFDAKATLDNLNSRISNLEQEKDRFFEKNKTLTEQLKPFKGKDADEINKALETVKNLNDKALLDANGIQALKAEMRASFDDEKAQLKTSFQEEMDGINQERNADQQLIYKLMVTNRFASSEFFSGEKPKTIYPPEDASKIFGEFFKVERGDNGDVNIIARDRDNKVIMSKTNHGEPAQFDEAIEIIIEQHPNKNRFLRSSESRGPNAHGNADWRGDDGAEKTATEKIAAGLKREYANRF